MTKTNSYKMIFDVPEGWDPVEVLTEIANNADEEKSSTGTIRIGNDSLDWQIIGENEIVEIDRRQKIVAALALMAFDLPQPFEPAAKSMLLAASLAKGMTTAEVGMGVGRYKALKQARDILDEMLSEEQTEKE